MQIDIVFRTTVNDHKLHTIARVLIGVGAIPAGDDAP
jgi:hypothetical protein